MGSVIVGHPYESVVPKQIALLSIIVDTPRVKPTFKLDNTIRRAEVKL